MLAAGGRVPLIDSQRMAALQAQRRAGARARGGCAGDAGGPGCAAGCHRRAGAASALQGSESGCPVSGSTLAKRCALCEQPAGAACCGLPLYGRASGLVLAEGQARSPHCACLGLQAMRESGGQQVRRPLSTPSPLSGARARAQGGGGALFDLSTAFEPNVSEYGTAVPPGLAAARLCLRPMQSARRPLLRGCTAPDSRRCSMQACGAILICMLRMHVGHLIQTGGHSSALARSVCPARGLFCARTCIVWVTQ